MFHPIRRLREKAEEVTYTGHYVPSDHEDTVMNQTSILAVGLMFLGVFILGLLTGPLPPEHGDALIFPIFLIILASAGVAYVFYIERMYRLVRKWRPASFTMPVAPGW